jgi:hypothetical protein
MIVTNHPFEHNEPPVDWTPRSTPLGPPAAPIGYQPSHEPLGPRAWPVGAPYPPPPPKPPRPNWVGPLVAGAVVLLVLLAAGGIAAVMLLRHRSAAPVVVSTAPAIVTVVGTLTLADAGGVLNLDDVRCSGMGGYSDIAEGAQVTVTDEGGTVLGVSQLSAGTLIGGGMTRSCDFAFTVNNVPAGHQFYGVSVSHRGTIQVPAADLDKVSLSLGN